MISQKRQGQAPFCLPVVIIDALLHTKTEPSKQRDTCEYGDRLKIETDPKIPPKAGSNLTFISAKIKFNFGNNNIHVL